MCNSSFCRCLGIIASIILGVGAGLLFGFGYIQALGIFTLPVIIVFAAIVLLFMLYMFTKSACTDSDCTQLRHALCADKGFIISSSAITFVLGLITIAFDFFPAAFLMTAVFFGVTMFVLGLTLVGIICFAASFCNHRCDCRPHIEERCDCNRSQNSLF